MLLRFQHLCVCLPYHLLPFASCNLLPFSLAYIFLSYLLILSFTLRIGLVYFQAGYHNRQLNLAYNVLCFEDLYFADLVGVDFILC